MSNELAIQRPLIKASTELSMFLGMEVSAMIDTIKAQCFKGKRPEEVTDAQLATYVSVANAMKLNPLLPGMMYPYPDRNGSVTVMLGPDGIFALLANNPDIVAQKDGGPAWWTTHGVDSAGKETCTGYINHRTKGLLAKTIWVDEWVVSSNPNWQTRRHHMAETRALKQAGRMVIHGMPTDADEHKLGEMLNVTPNSDDASASGKPVTTAGEQRSPQPERAKKNKGANAIPADTTPAKTEANAAPATDIVATPVNQEPPKADQTPAADAAKGPRTTLEDKEIIDALCEVVTAEGTMINVAKVPTPSVRVTLKGQFAGDVLHLGGATLDGENVVPNPAWKAGGLVKVKLRGRYNNTSQTMLIVVDEVQAEAPAQSSMDIS